MRDCAWSTGPSKRTTYCSLRPCMIVSANGVDDITCIGRAGASVADISSTSIAQLRVRPVCKVSLLRDVEHRPDRCGSMAGREWPKAGSYRCAGDCRTSTTSLLAMTGGAWMSGIDCDTGVPSAGGRGMPISVAAVAECAALFRPTLVRGLFDRYGFGEVAGLVYVGAFQDRYVIGQQLYRDRVQDGGDERIDAGQDDRFGSDAG